MVTANCSPTTDARERAQRMHGAWCLCLSDASSSSCATQKCLSFRPSSDPGAVQNRWSAEVPAPSASALLSASAPSALSHHRLRMSRQYHVRLVLSQYRPLVASIHLVTCQRLLAVECIFFFFFEFARTAAKTLVHGGTFQPDMFYDIALRTPKIKQEGI